MQVWRRVYNAVQSAVFAGVALTLAACATPQPEVNGTAMASAAAGCEWLDATYTRGGHVVTSEVIHVTSGSIAWTSLEPDDNAAEVEISAFIGPDGKLEIRMRRDDLLGDDREELLWLGPLFPTDILPVMTLIYRPDPSVSQGPWPEYGFSQPDVIVGFVSVGCHELRSPQRPPDWNSFAA